VANRTPALSVVHSCSRAGSAMSNRQQREEPPTIPPTSNDNHHHGWFDDASAAVDAARMGGGMPEVQCSESPAQAPVGFWRTVWQRWMGSRT